MSVNRYEFEDYGTNEDDGRYVTYEDYAELEQQLAESHRALRAETTAHENTQMRLEKMAAELGAIDSIHDDAVFITDEHYEQCPPEVQKIIRSLAVLQIPEHKAFLAEVRAQGVESGINTIIAMMNHQHPVASKVIDILRVHASQLRKGVQS